MLRSYKVVQPDLPPTHPHSRAAPPPLHTRQLADSWQSLSESFVRSRMRLDKNYEAAVKSISAEVAAIFTTLTLDVPDYDLVAQCLTETKFVSPQYSAREEAELVRLQTAAVERIQSNNRIQPIETIVEEEEFEPIPVSVPVPVAVKASKAKKTTATRRKRTAEESVDEIETDAMSVTETDESQTSSSEIEGETRATRPKRTRAKKDIVAAAPTKPKTTRAAKKKVEEVQVAAEPELEVGRTRSGRTRAAKVAAEVAMATANVDELPAKPKRARRKKDADDVEALELDVSVDSPAVPTPGASPKAAKQFIDPALLIDTVTRMDIVEEKKLTVTVENKDIRKHSVDVVVVEESKSMDQIISASPAPTAAVALLPVMSPKKSTLKSLMMADIPTIPLLPPLPAAKAVPVSAPMPVEPVMVAPPPPPSSLAAVMVNSPPPLPLFAPTVAAVAPHQSKSEKAQELKAAWMASYENSKQKQAEVAKVRDLSNENLAQKNSHSHSSDVSGGSEVSVSETVHENVHVSVIDIDAKTLLTGAAKAPLSSIQSAMPTTAVDIPALPKFDTARDDSHLIVTQFVDAMEDEVTVTTSTNNDDSKSIADDDDNEPGASDTASNDSISDDDESMDGESHYSYHSHGTSLAPQSHKSLTNKSTVDEKLLKAKERKATLEAKKKETASLTVAKKQAEAKRKREQQDEEKKRKMEETTKKSKTIGGTTAAVSTAAKEASVKAKTKGESAKVKKDIAKTMPAPAPVPTTVAATTDKARANIAATMTAATSATLTQSASEEKEEMTLLSQNLTTSSSALAPPQLPVRPLPAKPATSPDSASMPAPTSIPVHGTKPLVKFHGANAAIAANSATATVLKQNINIDNTTSTSTNTAAKPYAVMLPPPIPMPNPIAAPHTPDAKHSPQQLLMTATTKSATTAHIKSPSFVFTPISHPRRGLNVGDADNYEMSDAEADGSDEEDSENRPRKFVPHWARDPMLSKALKRQAELAVDPDTIFPPIDPHACNLTEIFKHVKRRRRFRERTSSARWDQDALNLAEIQQYKVAMGFRQFSLEE